MPFRPSIRLYESDSPMPWRSVAMMMTAMVVPAVVAVSLLGRPGAIAFVAAMPACLSAQDAGVRVSVLVTLVMGMTGLLALGQPDMALVVAPLLGLMVGICGSFGYARAAIRGLLTWPIFTSSIIEHQSQTLLFAVFILAMLWAQAVTWAFGKTGSNGGENPESREYAGVFGIVLAVGMTLSVWVGNAYFGSHGFWFPLTFVILVLPPHGQLFSRTVKRTVGTVLGTGIALGVAWASDAAWLTTALGALCLVFGFRMLPRNYTIFTALLTIAVLEILALVSDVDRLAYERIGTMGAAAAMTIALGVIGWSILRVAAPGALEALQQADGGEAPELEGERRLDSLASASRAG